MYAPPIKTNLARLTALGLLASSGPTFASTEIEEVVVTTQFRQQTSQTLPIASTMLSASQIDQYDIHGNTGLANITPGMSHAEFAAGQSYLAIRGILSIDDGPGMDNSVVVFLDGVYLGRLSNVDFDLLDIKRIEVLRGPQGTLFGRNAIGGAINIISNTPSDELELKAHVTAGDFGTLRYGGSINTALTPLVSSRFSVSHREHEGYTENILLHEENQNEDKNNLRWQLAFEPEGQYWLFSADYSEDNRADMGRFPVEESGLGSRATWLELGGDTGRSTAPISGFSNRNALGLSLTHHYDLKRGRIESVLAQRQSESDWAMASTGAPIAVNPPFPARDLDNGIYGSDVNDLIYEDINQTSLETRWIIQLSDSLHLTTGVFLLREESERTEHYQLVQNSMADGQELVGDEISQQHNITSSQALYSQAQWDFIENWRLLVGARWTKDTKNTASTSINCGQDDPLVASSGLCTVDSGAYLNLMSSVFQVEAEKSWTDISPKLAVQYFSDHNWMTYLTLARGFKSGGFPGSPGSEQIAQTPVDPESAWNYELGLKSDFFDRRLRLNSSVFYIDYQDLQIVRFGPSPDNPGFGSFTTTNIGKAEISGLELEAQWRVLNTLKLSANYAYLHSEINDLLIETTSGIVDASGSELRQAPQNKYHLAIDYELLNNKRGNYSIHYDYAYTDQQLSDYINRDTLIDEISQSNASLDWQSLSAEYQLSLWVKNIEDTRRVAHTYTVAGGVYGVWSAPRTVGLSFRWHYK